MSKEKESIFPEGQGGEQDNFARIVAQLNKNGGKENAPFLLERLGEIYERLKKLEDSLLNDLQTGRSLAKEHSSRKTFEFLYRSSLSGAMSGYVLHTVTRGLNPQENVCSDVNFKLFLKFFQVCEVIVGCLVVQANDDSYVFSNLINDSKAKGVFVLSFVRILFHVTIVAAEQSSLKKHSAQFTSENITIIQVQRQAPTAINRLLMAIHKVTSIGSNWLFREIAIQNKTATMEFAHVVQMCRDIPTQLNIIDVAFRLASMSRKHVETDNPDYNVQIFQQELLHQFSSSISDVWSEFWGHDTTLTLFDIKKNREYKSCVRKIVAHVNEKMSNKQVFSIPCKQIKLNWKKRASESLQIARENSKNPLWLDVNEYSFSLIVPETMELISGPMSLIREIEPTSKLKKTDSISIKIHFKTLKDHNTVETFLGDWLLAEKADGNIPYSISPEATYFEAIFESKLENLVSQFTKFVERFCDNATPFRRAAQSTLVISCDKTRNSTDGSSREVNEVSHLTVKEIHPSSVSKPFRKKRGEPKTKKNTAPLQSVSKENQQLSGTKSGATASLNEGEHSQGGSRNSGGYFGEGNKETDSSGKKRKTKTLKAKLENPKISKKRKKSRHSLCSNLGLSSIAWEVRTRKSLLSDEEQEDYIAITATKTAEKKTKSEKPLGHISTPGATELSTSPESISERLTVKQLEKIAADKYPKTFSRFFDKTNSKAWYSSGKKPKWKKAALVRALQLEDKGLQNTAQQKSQKSNPQSDATPTCKSKHKTRKARARGNAARESVGPKGSTMQKRRLNDISPATPSHKIPSSFDSKRRSVGKNNTAIQDQKTREKSYLLLHRAQETKVSSNSQDEEKMRCGSATRRILFDKSSLSSISQTKGLDNLNTAASVMHIDPGHTPRLESEPGFKDVSSKSFEGQTRITLPKLSSVTSPTSALPGKRRLGSMSSISIESNESEECSFVKEVNALFPTADSDEIKKLEFLMRELVSKRNDRDNNDNVQYGGSVDENTSSTRSENKEGHDRLTTKSFSTVNIHETKIKVPTFNLRSGSLSPFKLKTTTRKVVTKEFKRMTRRGMKKASKLLKNLQKDKESLVSNVEKVLKQHNTLKSARIISGNTKVGGKKKKYLHLIQQYSNDMDTLKSEYGQCKADFVRKLEAYKSFLKNSSIKQVQILEDINQQIRSSQKRLAEHVKDSNVYSSRKTAALKKYQATIQNQAENLKEKLSLFRSL